MTQRITVEDVLKLIEFELAQQSLSQDNIAEAIQRLHKFQTYWYSEILNKGRAPKIENVVHALFNANQTMLMLIQIMNTKFEATQLELARLKQFIASRIVGDQGENRGEGNELNLSDISYIKDSLNSINQSLLNVNPSYNLDIQMRYLSFPIIGALLNRLRIAFHRLVYFYISKHINNQNSINEIYKRQIQELVYLNLEYMNRLQALAKKVEELTKKENK